MNNDLRSTGVIVALCAIASLAHAEQPLLDLRTIPCDLTVPQFTTDEPAAGRRVKLQLPPFVETKFFHVLYLPTNWERGKKFPVIFEYPGNGPYKNKLGDTNSGRVQDCSLGFGISGGKDFIWVCLPFVDPKTKAHALQWWGDADATVAYCKAAVKQVCDSFGGDPQRLVLCGFSRGAIACNYIGLRDNEIAGLWRCMVVHSHYDGVRRWDYADSDAGSALIRLNRFNDRPQFITHESSVAETADYLKAIGTNGLGERFTLQSLPFANHTSEWVLREIPLRRVLREWVANQMKQILAAIVDTWRGFSLLGPQFLGNFCLESVPVPIILSGCGSACAPHHRYAHFASQTNVDDRLGKAFVAG